MFFKLLLLFSLSIARLPGLDWGGELFFHPDENNMAWGIERLAWPNLHPHFFAYGQFPLYLAYFSYQVWSFVSGSGSFQTVPFSKAIYLLRFWSAFFSVATVIIGWLLARKLFKKEKWANIYALLLIFSPGLIQMAHFGTTESILTFVALSLGYFCLNDNLFLVALISAIGLATKISAALFLVGPVVAIWLKRKSSKKKFRDLILWGGLTLLLTIIFSPYNFLDFQEFLRIVRYESGVARGTIPVFYTRQFINTRPIIFQITKIFPWVLGLPLFIFLLFGLAGYGRRIASLIWRKKGKISLTSNFHLLNSLFWPWFLFHGFLFAKWTRFMTPILPFLILLVVYFWQRLEETTKNQDERLFSFLNYALLLFSVFPGFLFLKIYLAPDIRFQASAWINKNLPQGAVILSEAGNVVDLPLFNHQSFEVINFDFYSLDGNPIRQRQLENLVARADYILLPSRRVFANHQRLPDKFPKTAAFYQQLFSGEMGFVLIKEFRPLPRWAEFFLGSDLNSEETWTVFDHPTIRLFARRSS